MGGLIYPKLIRKGWIFRIYPKYPRIYPSLMYVLTLVKVTNN